MAKQVQKFVVYNLRETYHELGTYEFKIVLHPKNFRHGHTSSMTMVDSDGKPMELDVKTWGRKVNCLFKIDKSVADGVSIATLDVIDSKGEKHNMRLTFWIIKP